MKTWITWVKRTFFAAPVLKRKTVDRSTLVEPLYEPCAACGRKHLTSVDRAGTRFIAGASAQRRHDQNVKKAVQAQGSDQV